MSDRVLLPHVEGDELDYARRLLRDEAAAVHSFADRVGASFIQALDLVHGLRPEGRAVVTGMGKAGFVGMKLSATLASVGVPSYFLHPADAIHGDLGRFTRDDVVIMLSNSGETEEVLRILPLLKAIGCSIVACTASSGSSLGKHSDVVIELGRIEEVCPLGLAPTTSTTVMLALGDALSMALLNRRGLTPEEYARYHPGGALGRSLLTIGQIMRRDDELCLVTGSMSAREVIHRISNTKGRPGAACVVDEAGTLTGIFTDGDLRRCLDREPAFLDHPIGKYATKTPHTINPERLAQETLRIMGDLKVDQIVVVNDLMRPVGLVDVQDLIALGLRSTAA